MCDPRRGSRGCHLAVATAILLVLGTGPVEGEQAAGVPSGASQAHEDLEAELLDELHRLEGEIEAWWARVAEEKALVTQLRRRNVYLRPVEGLSVPFSVLVRTGEAGEARHLFAALWSRVGPVLEGSPGLDSVTFVFDPSGVTRASSRPQGRIYVVGGRSAGRWGRSAEELRIPLERELARAVTDGWPWVLARWTDGRAPLLRTPLPRTPGSPLDEGLEARLFRALVTSGSPAGSACVDGALDACWSALGLADEPRAPDRWYHRPARDRERGDEVPSGLPFALRDWDACRRPSRSSPPGGCEEDFLTNPGAWMVAIPYAAVLRADLVDFAVRRGGAGALDRLLAPVPEDPTPAGTTLRSASTELHQRTFARGVRAGLVAASGMTADELMGAWREHVLEGRPDARQARPPIVLGALGWILLFVVAAARGARWTVA